MTDDTFWRTTPPRPVRFPKPWWESRQCRDVRTAAKRAGCRAIVRLNGELEVRRATGDTIGYVHFSAAGLCSTAHLLGCNSEVWASRVGGPFWRDLTHRDRASNVVAWFAEGMPSERPLVAYSIQKLVESMRRASERPHSV